MTDSVRWDLDGAVATITLNRPQARNALTAELKAELLRALRQAGSSPEVRAVLITGSVITAGDARRLLGPSGGELPPEAPASQPSRHSFDAAELS